ncbi:hypothetical protein ADIS_1242 [Lunatimonas lonarensis]|uniref:Rhamnogalacturonides degradation protein RhiN n=1 Tax=Lunatimonas lonarensis TaxID=1232681 RepID=R7ZWJ6_9BACT|nr:glycoside hydrolase family 88 protein [Lunatimonas lonarensis]EON78379.1 hypothetical protein ADIS_1242 [Lunatimonas lonarensis]
MDRRDFLKAISVTSAAIPLVSANAFSLYPSHSKNTRLVYHPASQITAMDIEVPEGKRLPFGWEAFAVKPGTEDPSVHLSFDLEGDVPYPSLRLRLCSVMDIREEMLIEVYLGRTSELIGTLDIRYPIVIQVFELLIPPAFHGKIGREGLSLKMVKGSTPAWFFSGGTNNPTNQLLTAHLLSHSTDNPTLNNFFSSFYSINSIQQFGWMEGCVLDGLYDMFKSTSNPLAKRVIDQHLALFFDEHRRLNYEGPRSQILYDLIYGIECPLPIAVITKLYPDHPAVDLLITYCMNDLREENNLTTEGCYTLAYPMAEAAAARYHKDLAELAIHHLLIRSDRLVKNGHIYQRETSDGMVSFESWARGVAWYMQGLVRSWMALHNHSEFRGLPGLETIKRLYLSSVEWALHYQQKNGLWYCYLAQPETGYDTSGSLGIAAAIALGQKNGILPTDVTKQLIKTKNAVKSYLTPDGMISGTAQSNKGGEELQKSGYRVISSYASGLYAQLIASLPDPL